MNALRVLCDCGWRVVVADHSAADVARADHAEECPIATYYGDGAS